MKAAPKGFDDSRNSGKNATVLTLVFCRVTVVLFLFALVSCAQFGPKPIPVATRVERERLYQLDQWSLDGRIAVRSSEDSGQAGLEWTHRGVTDRVRLSGPLGQGSVVIELSPNGIRITHADGRIEASDRPEALLASLFGLPLPVAALRYWVLGIAFPSEESSQLMGDTGRLESLRQFGWEIGYLAYERFGVLVLPQKLTAVSGSNKIKLVIDDWQFTE